MAQITGNTSTVTTGAVHIPEIWSADTLDAVQANLGIGNLITRKWEKEMKMGDIFRVGYISNLTANSKSAGTDVSLEAITEAEETVVITTHNYVAEGIENILKVQAKRSLRAKYASKHGYALGSASDVLVAAFAAAFDNTAGTLGVPVTYDNMVECDQNLNEANAPEADRFLYISAATKADLLRLDELKNADYVGAPGSAVRRASIGSEIMGANVFMSTLVQSPSGGQSNNWFGQKSGAALIIQETKSKGDFVVLADTDVLVSTQIQGQTEVLIPPVTAGGATALDNHNVTLRGNG